MAATRSQIPVSSLFLLALLGIPRVIAHDMHWLEPGDFLNAVLVFVPPVIWLVVVLWKYSDHAFKALLGIGLFYGLLLAVTHQLLWTRGFDTPPVLGGNLSGISPWANAVITRTFGFLSSLFTGAAIGLVLGVIGHLVSRFKFK